MDQEAAGIDLARQTNIAKGMTTRFRKAQHVANSLGLFMLRYLAVAGGDRKGETK